MDRPVSVGHGGPHETATLRPRDRPGATPRRPGWLPPGAASLFGLSAESSDTDGGARSLAARSVGLVWLIFLALPLSATFDDRAVSTGHKVVVVALVALFALSFALLSVLPDVLEARLSRPGLAAIVAAMWAMTVVLVAYDRASWDYEFIFSVFPAMRLFGPRLVTVVGIAALALAVGLLSGLDSGDLLFMVFLIVGTGISMFGVIRLIEANEALRLAQADRARVAVAEERLRFARDLHDLLGHSLSVITLKSEVAGKVLAADPERAGQEIAEIQSIARRALREVREAVSGYRQATLAVELAGARTALSAAEVTWDEDLPVSDLSDDVEAVLAWALREGVTNVVRHARATSCSMRLMVDRDTATITVTDDGVGGAGDAAARGNGLRGLAERVATAAGHLDVGPHPGGGYRLCVSVPMERT